MVSEQQPVINTYKERYPNPENAKLLCPLGKLRQPSFSICVSVDVHTVWSTNVCSGVPFSGLHREIRSGRGLPTAFLIISVIKMVTSSEAMRPRRVTWTKWLPGRKRAHHIPIARRGKMPEYIMDHTSTKIC